MTVLRLIGDDLTGTLDTTAGFTGLCGTVRVTWQEASTSLWGSSLSIDAGTREQDLAAAAVIAGKLASQLENADIAFKKIDSLLRGPWVAELAAVLQAGWWRRCIVAPAFPYQNRTTVGGCQLARLGDNWIPVSSDIASLLREANIPARHAAVTDGPVEGVAVYDAADDADLDRIAGLIGDPKDTNRVLWCGSGGLAAALARPATPPIDKRLSGPVLGLFGSDRPETEAQLSACGSCRLILPHYAVDDAAVVAQLAATGIVMVSLSLPSGTTRAAAATQIAASFSELICRLDRPGTLLVAGGETLKVLCLALGAEGLDVTGQVVPGLPRSIMRGGRWDGVPVISKSGAFGDQYVWRDLLHRNGFIPDRRNI